MTTVESRPRAQPSAASLLQRLLPSWPLVAFLFGVIRTVADPATPLSDPDTYLHVAAGQWMIAHHALPAHDPFSHTMAGAAWVPHEWLAELLFAITYDGTGWRGLLLLSGICFGITLAIFARHLLRHGEPFSTLVLVSACSAMLMSHVLARPHLVALPLLVLWCAELIAARDAERGPPFWLLPVVALWANLHGSYMFGLALAGFFAAEAVAFPRAAGARWTEARRWGGFVAAAALASLLTPNGLEGFLQPFRLMSMPTLQSSFVEWTSPNFQHFQPLEVWLLGAVAVGFLTGVKLPLPRVVLLLGLFHMALSHGRHTDLLALVGPLAIWASLGPQLAVKIRSDPPTPLARFFAERSMQPAWPAIVLTLLIAVGASLFTFVRPFKTADDPSTPKLALEAARRMALSGPVFNSEGYGGYLIFSGVPTFIDGRIEMYGDAFLRRYLEAASGKEPTLTDVLNQYKITWTLLARDDGAIGVLDHLPGWHRAYSDEHNVIHVRNEPPS